MQPSAAQLKAITRAQVTALREVESMRYTQQANMMTRNRDAVTKTNRNAYTFAE